MNSRNLKIKDKVIMNGIVNVNKPLNVSSFDVVRKIKKLSGVKKAGHAGTLDPRAQGVLIILLGEARKASNLFISRDKTYEAVVKLGEKSSTWDSDGKITVGKAVSPSSLEKIEEKINEFRGQYIHRVPDYSAKKHKGKTFYRLKRKGIKPPLRMQRSVIRKIKLIENNEESLRLSVTCTSGTYIRTLAVDIADKLNTVGYLKSLTRTAVNGFTLSNAVRPEKGEWERGFKTIDRALTVFPYVVLNKEASKKIKNGVMFRKEDIKRIKGEIKNKTYIVYGPDMKAAAIVRDYEGAAKFKRVFNC